MTNIGPQNVIMDDGFSFDPPQSTVPIDQLAEERSRASFTKTKEFLALKEHLEGRVLYYQQDFPGSIHAESMAGLTNEQRGERWAIANAIVNELVAILASYDNAMMGVENARSENT